MPKKSTAKKTDNLNVNSYLNRVNVEVQSNQSKVSMILGVLIILVVGILLFNYFNRPKNELGPAQQTQQGEDISPSNLPGKYTVKEGDTLFDISNKYYNDGYKYTEIAKTNNLTNADAIDTGQVLEIPKLETVTLPSTPSTQPTIPTDTIWGPKITENTYTVQSGDWLSTISGRAYGDIYAYERISKANNITDPNIIEINTVLIIPR